MQNPKKCVFTLKSFCKQSRMAKLFLYIFGLQCFIISFPHSLVSESLMAGGFTPSGFAALILCLSTWGFGWWACLGRGTAGFDANAPGLWMSPGFPMFILLLSCPFVAPPFKTCPLTCISKNTNTVNLSIITRRSLTSILEEVLFTSLCLISLHRWLSSYVNELSANCIALCKIVCFAVNFNITGDLLII